MYNFVQSIHQTNHRQLQRLKFPGHLPGLRQHTKTWKLECSKWQQLDQLIINQQATYAFQAPGAVPKSCPSPCFQRSSALHCRRSKCRGRLWCHRAKHQDAQQYSFPGVCDVVITQLHAAHMTQDLEGLVSIWSPGYLPKLRHQLSYIKSQQQSFFISICRWWPKTGSPSCNPPLFFQL